MWHMRYPLADGKATWWSPPRARRPCSATARWRLTRRTNAISAFLIGELVELPLTNRRIPIIADEHADPGIRHRL